MYQGSHRFMKLFYKYITKRVIMFFLLIGITVSSATILNSWAVHEEYLRQLKKFLQFPAGLKRQLGGGQMVKLPRLNFLQGITYLINNRIIVIALTRQLSKDADNTIGSVRLHNSQMDQKQCQDGGQMEIFQTLHLYQGFSGLLKMELCRYLLERITFIPIDDVKISRSCDR